MAITPLPAAPETTDTPQQFNSKAFAWVQSLDTFVTEANAQATEINGDVALAEEWASKTTGNVDDTDYSAKAWAIGGTGVTDTATRGAAKEWATETSGTVDGTEYSAKEYALGTQSGTGGSAKSWAQDADAVNGAGANDRSAKAWAQGASMTGATLGGSSKDWAQNTSSTVDGSEYSSKEYAVGTQIRGSTGSAKDWAQYTGGTVDGTNYSAKFWAEGALSSASDAEAAQIAAETAQTAAENAQTAAESAQSAAESARDATLAAYDQFDDRYLGAKSSDPSLDNDGNALVAGALYFNTTDEAMKLYTGSVWVAAYVTGGGFLAASNNLSDVSNVATARQNLDLEIGVDVQAYDANLDSINQNLGNTDSPSFSSLTLSGNIDVAGVIKNGSDVVLDQADIGVSVQAYDADTAKLDVAQTFTAEQVFSGGVVFQNRARENITVSATAATGTVTYNALTQSVLYYTSNATGNWTINIRGDASNSLDSIMSTGQSLTVVFMVTQGATAYYQTAIQIDGSAKTPKWQGGSAPTSGNASSVDAYLITIVKTGAATFTVFEAQTQFK